MSLAKSCPVPYTCPYIDEIIDIIKNAVVAQENGFCLSDLQEMQSQCIDNLEDLRAQNSDLREWGTEMESSVTLLEKRWDDMRDHFYYLER